MIIELTRNVNMIDDDNNNLRYFMASSYGHCTTGTNRKAQKIDIKFEDRIKNSKNFRISLFPWIRIDQLKKLLARDKYQNHLNWSDIRLFYKNIELLPDNKRCFDFGVDPQSKIIIKCVEPGSEYERGIINPYQIFDQIPQKIKNLILEVQSGLNNGRNPKLAEQGTSGTYFLENHMKKVVAIFKPFNEQPYASQNPRNYVGQTGQQGIRKGILSGESATRQVAAYLLDQQKFHEVPQTTYIQFFHPSFIKKQEATNPIVSDPQQMLNKQNQLKTKHGSLQAFIQSNDIAGNMGSKQFDVEQVHKIGILDLRILNCDRNEANILVRKLVSKQTKKKLFKLIPIDHGLSFPDNFQIYDQQMVWMGYSQAQKPFSQRSLQFIKNIDPIRDCQELRKKLGFREICLRNFRIAQTFLKRMAFEGFTLKEIGQMMYRKQQYSDEEEEQENKKKKQFSDLQKIVHYAENTNLLIKENGIKSTVNFQINFTKPKKRMQQSLPELESEMGIFNPPTKEEQAPKKTSLEKRSFQKTTEIKIEKESPNKTRNVSLPHLKIKNKESKQYGDKNKQKKRDNRGKIKMGKSHEKQWDEVFFHYFQEFLERYIQEKKCKRGLLGSRSRLMSEDINYNF